ncbi:MAG: phytanoyl-CoA dioxygenase family protein [Pseudomonadota bacterium]
MNLQTNLTPDLLPSEADIVSYEENGYFIAPQVIPHELLDAVAGIIERHQAGHRDRELKAAARFSDWQDGDAAVVRNNEFVSLQNDVVRELVRFPAIGAIAARLARSRAVRLFDDQLVVKPPAAGEDASKTVVGWHTDGSYWSTCTSNAMLTAWIPLHDVSEENGTLCVVAGSHRWDESDHVRGFNDTDFNSLESRIGRKVGGDLIHPVNMKKGQMSFHHMRALHGSMPNVSLAPRCAVALHMQDDANSYQEFRTPDGTLVVLPHDRLAREDAAGHPDYRDPDVFPELWPGDR